MSGGGGNILARAARAFAERDTWRGVLSDAYRYCLPGSIAWRDGAATPVDAAVYDATAPVAVDEWAARIAHGVGFGFRELCDLEPGEPLRASMAPEVLKQVADVLAQAQAVLHAILDRSNLLGELYPALREACISTGALLVHEGDTTMPLRFEAVPLDRLAIREGADGVIDAVYRRHTLRPDDVRRLWPAASVPDTTRRTTGAETPPMTLIEAYERDAPAGRRGATGGDDYAYSVVIEGSGAVILSERRPERWILFRAERTAGATYGSGPALRMLPDIRTANRVVELVLKNASIAVTGMWQADDDGVLNPANVRLVPGAIIPKAVGSSGLTPLAPAGQFDVAQVVLADLRANIRRAIAGPSLPPIDGGVRSATEFAMRDQEITVLSAPSHTRLVRELVLPIYRIAADILARRGLLPDLDIAGGAVRVVQRSPYRDMAARAEHGHRMTGLQMAAAIDPAALNVVLRTEAAVEQVLAAFGWRPADFTAAEERQAKREAMAEQQAREMAARTGQPAGGAAAGMAQGMEMTGGMV